MHVDVRNEIGIDRPVDAVAVHAGDPSHAPEWYANIDSERAPRLCGYGLRMEPLDALDNSYEILRAHLMEVGDADLTAPTPCSDWDVGALVGHVIDAIAMFPAWLAGGAPGEPPARTGDLVTSFDEAVAANRAAWQQPGALEREVSMLPGMRFFDLNLLDVVVHTWDLATALGRVPGLDDGAVELAYARWCAAPLDTSRQMGAFGPEVTPGTDAPVLVLLLGLTGRSG